MPGRPFGFRLLLRQDRLFAFGAVFVFAIARGLARLWRELWKRGKGVSWWLLGCSPTW
jgi:hypothetical protein